MVVYPVSGTLFVAGFPAANAQLCFHPTSESEVKYMSVGASDAEGHYRLTTFRANDGAPAGEYAVTVVWPIDSIPKDECLDATVHDRLRGVCCDAAKTPLRAVIQPGNNELRLQVEIPSSGWSLPKRREVEQHKKERE